MLVSVGGAGGQIDMTVDEEVAAYEKRTGITLSAHNKSILRSMIERENRWWETEEGRVLKDSNRYRDDN
jgi:hypothetical protein